MDERGSEERRVKTKIGIIGNGSDKFTPHGATIAKAVIVEILMANHKPVLMSGHSRMGGIDIWAEEIATQLGHEKDIKAPKTESWGGDYGYKERNLDIARSSDYLYVIVADSYPPDYNGQTFLKDGRQYCYHCNTFNHVKSGACYTRKLFEKAKSKLGVTVIIPNVGNVVIYKVGDKAHTKNFSE